MSVIPILNWAEPRTRARILQKGFTEDALWSKVEEIVKDVKRRGDKALLEYTEAFDGCSLKTEEIRVKPEEIEEAYKVVDNSFLAVLRQAKEGILSYHRLQKQKDWFAQDERGSLVGQVYRPLERVGIYVPGGTAIYPSSVLMNGLPAMVAGVREIVMVTPPGKDGKIPPATLVAAHEAGVSEIYRMGGAQAIAALAYGTGSIRPVDKIVGPGNIYVTLAKKMVYGAVGIDMLAGPSEILIIGDGNVQASYAAADLLSQAEHDVLARAMLVTDSAEWARQVAVELAGQLEQLPRSEIARESLANQGAIVIVRDQEEAFSVANMVAPEHLELLISHPWSGLARVKHAGAVFLGPYSPEPIGDYWAGPNHVLPTGGSARYASVLSVDDFCKRSSVIHYSRQGLENAAGPIQVLAGAEKLTAHARAVTIRLKEEQR